MLLMPQISVIMPVYNTRKEYLCEAIESILAQSFADFELIIIDDASTNGNLEEITAYAQQDNRIKIIYNQINQGVSKARNLGLEKSSGNYIAFVDADDICHPELLKSLYENIIHYKADVAGCLTESIDGRCSLLFFYHKINKMKLYSSPLDAFFQKRFIRSEVHGRLYRKELLSDIRFPEGIRYEDVYVTSLIMSKAQSMIIVGKSLYTYRKHDNSFMRSEFTIENAQYYLKIIKAIYDYFYQTNNSRLQDIKKYILNKRIKMIFNQSVRRQPDPKKQRQIFEYLQPKLKEFYEQGIIDYRGLRLKHKIALWLLLNKENPSLSLTWLTLLKEI